MELLDKYRETVGDATISDLLIDGARECWLLEDLVRELPIEPPESLEAWVARWKIPHVTAIPSGRFRVTYVWSPHFRCFVPLLNAVPGFVAIEMHWGNRAKDTDGCLIVGRTHLDDTDFVGESNAAWDALMPKLEAAWGVRRLEIDDRGKPIRYSEPNDGQDVWITVDRGALLDPTSSAGSFSAA